MHRLLEDTTTFGPEEEVHHKDHNRDDLSSFEMHNEVFNWSFRNNPNAEAFRRSMLPFYLLKEDLDWVYPRYIEYSDLARNLFEKSFIKVKVVL